LHGGFGFTDEYAVSRLYRGARYGTLGGGTTETLRDLIGKRIVDAAGTGADLLAYDMMNGA
jgi:alkylation response protein AidB-like acyl-CoA dehydrogenase